MEAGVVVEENDRRRADILSALGQFANESRLRSKAPDPDLRTGRVQVYNVLAIDLSELVSNPTLDRRILHHLRASDRLTPQLKEALEGKVADCSSTRREMEERARRALHLGGKAVWTDQFLDRFAPIDLPVDDKLVCKGTDVPKRERISTHDESVLHHVRFMGAKLRLFRDGVLCFTLRTEFDETSGDGGGTPTPATVRQVIDRLAELDAVAAESFRRALDQFLNNQRIGQALTGSLRADGVDHRFGLASPESLGKEDLARKAKRHTAIFVENFFDGPKIDAQTAGQGFRGKPDGSFKVGLQEVLGSSSLAGILNTATWYQSYNSRYVAGLARKEIGYRDDEIYLTDRKATVVSAEGFWNEGDSLSQYMFDVVLAIEYNVARLAYLASTLNYYQDHEDVRNIEGADPGEALPRVVDSRGILSLVEESLDLTLLIDHGFTRLFVERLRVELGFEKAIGYIRQRVEDASTSVGLKSSVQAAEHTSKDSLKAALENNALQSTIKKWAAAAAIVAVVALLVGNALSSYLSTRPTKVEIMELCVQQPREGEVAPVRIRQCE